MLRTVLLVVAGLVAGLAAARWLTSSTRAAGPPQPSGAVSAPSDLPARFAELQRQLAAETERRGALEQRVGELDAQIEALRAAVATAPPGDRAANPRDSSAASAGAGATPQGFGRRFRGVIDGAKDRHRFVADRLDDATAPAFAHRAHEIEALPDSDKGLRVADLFIETGAARHVGEKDSELGIGLAHRSNRLS